MQNTAQIKLEININSNKKLVTITGKTTIDGKQIIDYIKEIDSGENGVFLDDVFSMLSKPVEIDKRFKGATGIR